MDFALPPGVRRLPLPASRRRDAAATRADAGLVALLDDQPAAWAPADEEVARLTAAPR